MRFHEYKKLQDLGNMNMRDREYVTQLAGTHNMFICNQSTFGMPFLLDQEK